MRYFMNGDTFEQFSVPADVLSGNGQYITKKGDQVDLQFFREAPIGIMLPKCLT